MSCSPRFCRRFGRWAKGWSDERADDRAIVPARSGQEQRLEAVDPVAVEESGDGLVDELRLTREDSDRPATDSLGVLGIEVEPREAQVVKVVVFFFHQRSASDIMTIAASAASRCSTDDKMMASRYFSGREHKARSARRWASLAHAASRGEGGEAGPPRPRVATSPKPKLDKLPFIGALGVADLCSSVGGVAADLITVSVKLPDLPEFRTEPLALIVAGVGESLSPLVLGMALLSTTALVCALEPRRLRRLS